MGKVAELVKDERIEGISELRDESDKDGLRVVIELRRGESGEGVCRSAGRTWAARPQSSTAATASRRAWASLSRLKGLSSIGISPNSLPWLLSA